jgi:4-amino-4-deoxy-L-arabinose transferase-like glycosyltransferase
LTPARAALPSRWLLILTLTAVVAFTALRLVTAATLDLRSDEAYYWTWSQQSPLSYLDQPPMVAWFERAGQLVFGDTALGARFAQILALPLIELILADIARRRTGHWNAALFVVLAMECTLNYALFSIVVEPNLPLLLFTSLILWAIVRLDETADARWWLLVGTAGGLALLSKYIVLLLAPALLVFLLLDPRHRRWLRTFWPYLAVVIAAAIFSPVVIWNARHEWASFAFQSVRLGAGGAPSLDGLVRFVMYETLWVGPVLLLATIIGSAALLISALRSRRAVEAMLAAAFLFPLAWLAVRSLTLQINQSWAWFLWPVGIVALALALPWGGAPRRIAGLIGVIAATGIPAVAALFWHASFDNSVWFGRGDPFGQDAGYGEMAEEALATARAHGATWIATTEYRTYANLLWHVGREIPVLQVNERARFLDFSLPDPRKLQGVALYVHAAAAPPLLANVAARPLPPLPVRWRGVEMQAFSLALLDAYQPLLDPLPGSPAYAWGN